MVGGERPWQEIRRRKAGKTPGYDKRWKRKEDPRETSFYVANLPNGTMSMDLAKCFESFGRVVDTYVAAKRDKAGGLFGFVRFSGVEDKWEMERSLACVNLNNARLVVNVAKFDRDGKPCSREKVRVPHPNVPNPPSRFQGHRSAAPIMENSSYKDALLRKHVVMEASVPDDAVFDVVQWYDKSMIGKMIDFNQLVYLHQSIKLISDKISRLKYLGGLLEEDSDWCPGWINKPEKKPICSDHLDLPAKERCMSPEKEEAMQPEKFEESQPAGNGNAEQLNSHGEFNPACMGNRLYRDNGSKGENFSNSNIFWFKSNNNSGESGHPSPTSPNVSEVAQRIKTMVGLAPRKRPRTDSLDSDPYDIDRFIGDPHLLANSSRPCIITGNCNPPPPPIPDLNSHLNTSQSEGSGEHIPDTWDRLDSDPILDPDSRISAEIEATIHMGNELGINLANFEDMVRTVIEGERENEVVQ
ncbi:hypothetical protein L1987_63236 [Smallanthus sonchifolius]|uniref:Uncharacterized protein n=1 Tax=Smallanthus sonchifolius TaxID=185202 RepID=A0ACB9CCQ0_9ASTR|nr:hypothetical protein L1987_63236 [Smallanthus sonchifolius]